MATIAETGVTIAYDVQVPVGDGARLAADVYRPAGEGRYPVILIRTPYDKLATPAGFAPYGIDPLAMVRAGYAVVIQDVRGTGASPGRLRHFHHESADGVASVLWSARQNWSAGSVAMAGASYLGATQLLTAVEGPSALKAIVPVVTGSEYYEGWAYQGGALQLGFVQTWAVEMALADLDRRERLGQDVNADREVLGQVVADPWRAFRQLPLVELPQQAPSLFNYAEWLRHPDRDDLWRSLAINRRYGKVDVPALHIAGWNDIFLKGSLENYVGLRTGAATEHARESQYLIVAPWGHTVTGECVGDVWYGAAAGWREFDPVSAHIEFFNAFLKRGARPREAGRVQIFVMGANRWREEEDWPLARAVDTRFYLRADEGLTHETPAEEPPDEFRYDPRDPVPTVGGNTVLPGGGFLLGPRDRRAVQQRTDVLVYASDILQRDTEVTGPVSARLYVTTSARDTDFTLALIDMYPDGRAIGIADGILRMRYRGGFEAQGATEPERVYEIKVDLVGTSNVFRAGHRIGVEISSSNFPRFDRNPNHGGVIAEATERDFVVASQRVFHDAARASYVTLPVVPP